MTFLKERRRHYRVEIQTDVWIGREGIFTRSAAMLREVSESGAFIETSQNHGVGSVVSLRFRVPPDDEEVTCAALVRHTGGGRGLGVAFLDMAPHAYARLRRFIRHQMDRHQSGHR